jgi:hypothetical protein
MKKRIERLEKKVKTSRRLPKLVFWEKEPTEQELKELKENNLEPVKVKFK